MLVPRWRCFGPALFVRGTARFCGVWTPIPLSVAHQITCPSFPVPPSFSPIGESSMRRERTIEAKYITSKCNSFYDIRRFLLRDSGRTPH